MHHLDDTTVDSADICRRTSKDPVLSKVYQAVRSGINLPETKLSGFYSPRAPHTTTGVTPVELLMKRKLQTNLDRLRLFTYTTVLLSQDHQKFHHDRTAKMRMFHKGQEVFAQNFNSGPWWLAGNVLMPIVLDDETFREREREREREKETE